MQHVSQFNLQQKVFDMLSFNTKVFSNLEKRALSLIQKRTSALTKSLFVLWVFAARRKSRQRKIVRCVFKKWKFAAKFDIV